MPETWLITGANRGLGLEFTKQLHARGAQLIATCRRPEEAAELRELDVRIEPLDVTSSTSVQALKSSLAGTTIDVLVNNAGIGVRSKPLEEVDPEELLTFFNTNAVGALRVTQALLGNLRAGQVRKVAQITSKMGSMADNGSGGAYAYRASKAALNMVNKSLSVDLSSEGFTCLTLHPGWVRTAMGGPGAPLSEPESVSGLLRVIDGAAPQDTGAFFDYAGEPVSW